MGSTPLAEQDEAIAQHEDSDADADTRLGLLGNHGWHPMAS
jgi:hypothetical protein